MSWSVASVDYRRLSSDLLPLVKQHLRVSFPDDDAIITSCIRRAISLVERKSGWRIFPAEINWSPVETANSSLPSYQCPVQPVSAFTLHSGAVDLSAEYELRSAAVTDPVWLANKAGQPFPADALSKLTVGYATAPSMVPEIEDGVLRIAGTLYEYRETVGVGGLDFIPGFMDDMISGLWIPRI
jgi:uncharacterized phiE125 gp8 family phage protein